MDMSKLGNDYATAKALHVKGLSIRQISEKTGISYDALAKYAVRNGWTELRDKSVQLLSNHVQGKMVEAATKHLLDMSDLADTAITCIKGKPIGAMPLDDLAKLASIADTFDRIARRTHRLDEASGPKTQLNLQVNYPAAASPGSAPWIIQDAKPVIELTEGTAQGEADAK